MFGLIAPCKHQLGDELLEQWRAHLCGLCLSLRDRYGQLSRATTNTDAVMTSVLLQAQRTAPASTGTAGPCPLRGMRTATVIAPGELSARLAGTASLTLAAAKAADVVAEHRTGLNPARPLLAKAAGKLSSGLRGKAMSDAKMSQAIDSAGLLTALSQQGELERAVRLGDTLVAVTAPSARAAGAIFAATADLAGTSENRDVLERMGQAYGRLAHLLDAVEDLDSDARSGSFNPLRATGRTIAEARALSLESARTIRLGVRSLVLADGRLLKILLIDCVHAALHRVFDPMPSRENGRPSPSAASYPPGQGAGSGAASAGGTQPFWRNVIPWIGVYCTGFAMCAGHTNPCTGRRHQAGCTGCDCFDCDCFDCDCCCDCTSTSASAPEHRFGDGGLHAGCTVAS